MIRNWIETERLSGLRAGGRFVLRIFPYCMMGTAVLSMEKSAALEWKSKSGFYYLKFQWTSQLACAKMEKNEDRRDLYAG